MIYALGETLLDIIFKNDGSISANPGGAMLNMSVSLARRNSGVTLISELGNDLTGKRIISFLTETGISSRCITVYDSVKTSLALAYLDKDAKPSYEFYKTYPPGRKLETDIEFSKDDFLLFGSVYSLDPAIRSDIVSIVNKARQNGTVIIYDPNIRHAYHLKDESFRKAVFENMAIARIIKGSDEDFVNIFGDGDPYRWNEMIKNINPDANVIFTLGQKGSISFVNGEIIEMPALPVKAVSTVGAGDAFNAGMLYTLQQSGKKPKDLINADWNKILDTATRFAAEVCGREENYVE